MTKGGYTGGSTIIHVAKPSISEKAKKSAKLNAEQSRLRQAQKEWLAERGIEPNKRVKWKKHNKVSKLS